MDMTNIKLNLSYYLCAIFQLPEQYINNTFIPCRAAIANSENWINISLVVQVKQDLKGKQVINITDVWDVLLEDLDHGER